MSTIQISVLICTKDRPAKLFHAISSVLASIEGFDAEIVVVDQSVFHQTKEVIESFQDLHIRYFFTNMRGLSRARNFAISLARGEVLVFTDDDCRVDDNWIYEILHAFENNPGVFAVFGKTLAHKPNDSVSITYETRISPFGKSSHAIMDNSYSCRSLIIKEEPGFFDFPCTPSENIGSSNNFAAHRELFAKAGKFLVQLGAGTWINGGEDTEIVYRWLSKGYKLMYVPSVVVYHDSWMNKAEEKLLLNKYTTAAIAVFSYYRFCGDTFADLVLRYRWMRILSCYSLRNNSREKNKPLKMESPLPFIRGLIGGLYLYMSVHS